VPEVIHQFVQPFEDDDGVLYFVHALGQPMADGRWEGTLQFVAEGHPVLQTPRETTQSNRAALVYWASGLEPVYLEGAFERALRQASEAGARR
jgi:hypothetical protein